MKLRSFFLGRQALALLALGALAMPSLVRAAGAPAETPRVAPEEAVKMAAKGQAVIVDVRAKSDYDLEHAEGAVSIPLNELEARMAELPKDKYIAAYCT
jgi:predicted sulfurtransferase